MKVLPTARILLVDPQTDRRHATQLALLDFGIANVIEASTLQELPDLTGQIDLFQSGGATDSTSAETAHAPAGVDLLVVQADVTADAPDDFPDNPCRDDRTMPAILVAPLPASQLERIMAQKGYDAALGAPLSPRLLYRRIGSVLQLARRASRASTPEVSPEHDRDKAASSDGDVGSHPVTSAWT